MQGKLATNCANGYAVALNTLCGFFLFSFSKSNNLTNIMFNGTEASGAAVEILALVKKLKEKYKHNAEAVEALTEVEKEAKGIKAAGDSGWY